MIDESGIKSFAHLRAAIDLSEQLLVMCQSQLGMLAKFLQAKLTTDCNALRSSNHQTRQPTIHPSGLSTTSTIFSKEFAASTEGTGAPIHCHSTHRSVAG